MNIRDLTYLINLAKTSHFSDAAKLSFVSQPTLSIQIKKLEETLGCVLVERHGKKTILTEAGKAAVLRAEKIIGDIHDLENHMQSFQDPFSGTLKIGIFPTLAPYLLPHIITPIKRSMPKLKLQLFESVTETCIDNLKQSSWDVILIADRISEANLAGIPLFKEPFYLALPTTHSLAHYDTVKASTIPEGEMLLLETGHCLRDQSIHYCEKNHKSFQQQFFATSLETLISMVALGEGITLIPELATFALKQYKIIIKPLAPSPYRTIYMYWRKSSGKIQCIEKLQTIILNLKTLDHLTN